MMRVLGFSVGLSVRLCTSVVHVEPRVKWRKCTVNRRKRSGLEDVQWKGSKGVTAAAWDQICGHTSCSLVSTPSVGPRWRSWPFSLLRTYREERSGRMGSCEANEGLNENHRARTNWRGCRKVVGSCRERGKQAIRFAKGETWFVYQTGVCPLLYLDCPIICPFLSLSQLQTHQ